MCERAHYWIRSKTPERAKRSKLHGVAEVGDELDLLLRFDIGREPVEHFHSAQRAETARRALAAAFDRAELHGEARLLQHVHRVVEDNDARMADQPVLGGE